jgi:hypothetical protein
MSRAWIEERSAANQRLMPGCSPEQLAPQSLINPDAGNYAANEQHGHLANTFLNVFKKSMSENRSKVKIILNAFKASKTL